MLLTALPPAPPTPPRCAASIPSAVDLRIVGISSFVERPPAWSGWTNYELLRNRTCAPVPVVVFRCATASAQLAHPPTTPGRLTSLTIKVLCFPPV